MLFRSVGFCYPYGVYTKQSINILRKENFLYARTTLSSPIIKDKLLLHPTAKWHKININNMTRKRIIFWGHSYEFRDEKDWHKVSCMYENLTQRTDVKIVDFKTLISEII